MVNCSIPVQLIDQLPMAVVVINCPPLRGQLIACHPHEQISLLLHPHYADAAIVAVVRRDVRNAARLARRLSALTDARFKGGVVRRETTSPAPGENATPFFRVTKRQPDFADYQPFKHILTVTDVPPKTPAWRTK